MEITTKLKALYSHSRTILAARLLQIGGGLVAVSDGIMPILTGQDWTPVTSFLFRHVPQEFRPLAVGIAITAAGAVFEWLRRKTTQSVTENIADATGTPPEPDVKA